MAEGSRELQMWLGANVSEAYRAPVLAVADSLEDLRSSDLDELEAVLALNSWPVLTQPAERRVGSVSALSRAVEGRPARGDAHLAAPMTPPTDE